MPEPLQEFFAGHPSGLAVHERILAALADIGSVEFRVTRSQVAYRRRHGFAYLWLPGRYLAHPDAELVLSIALGRHVESPRFKQVVQPSARHWMHHLELAEPDDIDDEVVAWLLEAADRAT